MSPTPCYRAEIQKPGLARGLQGFMNSLYCELAWSANSLGGDNLQAG